MATPHPQAPATAEMHVRDDGTAWVVLGGAWSLRHRMPDLTALERVLRKRGKGRLERVKLTAPDLGAWDTGLAVFVIGARQLAVRHGLTCDIADLPERLRELAEEGDVRPAATPATSPRRRLLTTRLGEATHRAADGLHDHMRFFGECIQTLVRMLLRPFSFRWAESIEQMRRCGAAALPIVGLISALVGVIMAFVAAVQLRQFGADIFVADLVGLAVFREMGPMMAAIVLTGRTGAAYAAELGNMVLGEEVDALETFGVRPVDFLVAPRLVALLTMMPLLALYANFLGVVGGAVVAQSVLGIVPAAYFVEMQTAVGLQDIGTGLIKSVIFGWIVAYSGCYRGMRAGRSSVAVGEATTGAVVMGILFIIVTDAAFTVVFSILGW